MESVKPLNLAPPWKSTADWQAANRSIAFHRRRYHLHFDKVTTLSQKLNVCLSSISPMLDELCANTCIFCPEPCCLAAKVWFDFQDLLFLHTSHHPIPLAQPLQNLKCTCRYLSHRGCTLPRLMRPWICTWYLCPVQKKRLESRRPVQIEVFNRAVVEIKSYRWELEQEFIRIVC